MSQSCDDCCTLCASATKDNDLLNGVGGGRHCSVLGGLLVVWC
jgi:hypothetical protein